MMVLLRFIHIILGAFWFGTVVFMARFLMPSMNAIGPAAGPVMAQLNQRKVSNAMMGAAILNVISGVWMMFLLAGGSMGTWMQLRSSQVFSAGGTLAILALVIGMVMNPPAVKKLGAIAGAAAKRGSPPTPEEAAQIAALQARLRAGTAIVAVLLFFAVTAMAIARYV